MAKFDKTGILDAIAALVAPGVITERTALDYAYLAGFRAATEQIGKESVSADQLARLNQRVG